MLSAIDIADIGDFWVRLSVLPELPDIHVLMALETSPSQLSEPMKSG